MGGMKGDVAVMNRAETLEWIDLILDSLDQHEMMAIIRESADQFDGEFFETINSETERYIAANDQATADHLTSIARAIAVVRQNRAENL
jgi:hypothetical protein